MLPIAPCRDNALMRRAILTDVRKRTLPTCSDRQVGSVLLCLSDSTYDVYHTTRVQQPSIDGTATFSQYWSVRKGKRTEDTVDVTAHFEGWEALGLELGKLYEVALTVEGYQSSGVADIYENIISIE